MTTIAMTSKMNRTHYNSGNVFNKNTYLATVECEDNEWHEFEVDANSYNEAYAKAGRRAQAQYSDIIYVDVQLTA